MTQPAPRFGVIIPTYNESQLALLLPKFDFQQMPPVIVVDDDSMAVTKQFPVTVLRHAQRTSVGAGIRTGLLHLLESKFEVAVIMAGNNKDDPVDIPVLLQAIADGADYVQGSRSLSGAEAANTPLARRFITRAVPVLWSLRFGRLLTEVTNGFRAYRLSLLNDPQIDIRQGWLSRYELEYYLHYKVLALGYRYVEAPFAKRYPTDGMPTTKIKLAHDWWSLLRAFVLLTLGVRKWS